MKHERRPSIWFYVGLVSLILALGPFLLGFFAVLTCGLIFLPLVFLMVFLIWFGPYVLLHWILWGRNAVGNQPNTATDIQVRRPLPGNRPAVRWIGVISVVVGVALYYLALLGVFQSGF